MTGRFGVAGWIRGRQPHRGTQSANKSGTPFKSDRQSLGNEQLTGHLTGRSIEYVVDHCEKVLAAARAGLHRDTTGERRSRWHR